MATLRSGKRLRATRPARPEMLESLAGDADPMVRAAVAANAACVPGTLAKILESSSDLICEAAASNPNYPPGVLAALAASADFNDKMAAADHPNCPPEVLAARALLEHAAHDEHAYVRVAVAESGRCATHLLERLAGDEDKAVRDAAKRMLGRVG